MSQAGRLGRAGAATIIVALLLAALAVGACSRATAQPTAGVIVRAASATPTLMPTFMPTLAPSPVPTRAAEVAPPATGRWIEVDVTAYVVRLREGARILREITPIAVGAKIDTGEYESTQTGLFHVYNKIAGRTYDAPYQTYIDWWVGFDPEKANGFHSFLLDERGAVADASTGRVSNGCIRTGDPEALFAFAEVGMPVLVHP